MSDIELATVTIDGRRYPVVDVDVSVHSHPFWTGKGRVLDSEGRVEAFERRYGTLSRRRKHVVPKTECHCLAVRPMLEPCFSIE